MFAYLVAPLAAALIFSLPTHAGALELFSQTPGPGTGGILSFGAVNVEGADDFEFSNSSIVDEIKFWTDGTVASQAFDYAFWTDAGGTPGTELVRQTVTPTVPPAVVGAGPLTEWTVSIDPISFAADQRFWLSLFFNSTDTFGWKFTSSVWGNNATSGPRPGAGFPNPYGGDVAFVLNGQEVPVPPTILLFVAGAAGLALRMGVSGRR